MQWHNLKTCARVRPCKVGSFLTHMPRMLPKNAAWWALMAHGPVCSHTLYIHHYDNVNKCSGAPQTAARKHQPIILRIMAALKMFLFKKTLPYYKNNTNNQKYFTIVNS
jgi:hypothetical protein